MFLDDEDSEARPWLQRLFQRGRMTFVGMFACAAMLVGLAATAHAETSPQHLPGAAALAAQASPSQDAGKNTGQPSQLSSPAAPIAVDPMPTASTPIVAPHLATNPNGLTMPRTETLSDRYILLGLMMLCFAAMAAGSLALWRRSLKELFRAESGRRRA